jgi:formylglycine-generating enzyme required for sulfatase activity
VGLRDGPAPFSQSTGLDAIEGVLKMRRIHKADHRLPLSVRLPVGVIAMLLALVFAAPAAFDSDNYPAQSRPHRRSGTRARRRPSEPWLRDFEFDTVTINSKGVITSRRKGHARYFVEDINGIALEMVEIPRGTFMMGSPASEQGRAYSEGPQHQVTVPGFYIGKYQVTWGLWKEVAKLPAVARELYIRRSDLTEGDKLPVDSADWVDAMEFCARLSRATGRNYRLPSEAEWEYACRGGNTAAFAFGDNITPQVVNFNGDFPHGSAPEGLSRRETIPVGSLGIANGFGLYDMHGNTSEWCLDYRHNDYNGAPTDGSAWETGGESGYRVLRGCSYSVGADGCRSASRASGSLGYSFNGFRVVADAPSR